MCCTSVLLATRVTASDIQVIYKFYSYITRANLRARTTLVLTIYSRTKQECFKSELKALRAIYECITGEIK